MKLDCVYMWVEPQENCPEKFRGNGPFEVTLEDLETLSKSYDVAIMHLRQKQPTKKEQQAGALPVPDKVTLALDSIGGKFRQR